MSKRNYLSIAELEEYAGITVTDTAEANDQISQAEELIDTYVGFQQKAIAIEYLGLAVSGSTSGIKLQLEHQNIFEKNYLKGCMLEIIGGTGAGERQIILSNTLDGTVVTETFTTALDNTSFYKIFQLGKFPRLQDSHYDSLSTETYYKFIPEAVKKAVASQVEYKIAMGDSFFSTNKSNIKSESIGDYSYTKSLSGGGSTNDLIAPKAKMYLRGIRNITGSLEV